MAMTKAERNRLVELEEELRRAKAWRRTEPVEPDVPIPGYDGPRLSKGWLYNAHLGSYGSTAIVERACSSTVSHAFGQDDKTTTQQPRRLYSTKLLALKAARYDLEQQMEKILAETDRQIEQAAMEADAVGSPS